MRRARYAEYAMTAFKRTVAREALRLPVIFGLLGYGILSWVIGTRPEAGVGLSADGFCFGISECWISDGGR